MLQGGDKLKGILEGIAAAATNAKEVRVGFLEGSTYPDGTPVAMVAAINNWGAPSRGQPPRPFFSQMVADKSPEWGPATGALLIANNYDAAKTLAQVGEAVAGQLRQSIVDFSSVPLAPSTIARKGFDKQLVERGIMLNSVDFEVKQKS